MKDQLDILGRLVDLGGEDRVLAQTISKLLEYTLDKHQGDLEEISAKLRALEEQFRMPSDVFYQKFHRGEVGDEEEFFAGMPCCRCGNVFSNVCPFCRHTGLYNQGYR